MKIVIVKIKNLGGSLSKDRDSMVWKLSGTR